MRLCSTGEMDFPRSLALQRVTKRQRRRSPPIPSIPTRRKVAGLEEGDDDEGGAAGFSNTQEQVFFRSLLSRSLPRPQFNDCCCLLLLLLLSFFGATAAAAAATAAASNSSNS